MSDALSWNKHDVERKIGLRGGRGTNAGLVLPLGIAMVGTVAFFAILTLFRQTRFAAMFLERGLIPYPIVFLAFWSLGILYVKRAKAAQNRKALSHQILPEGVAFVLTSVTADRVVTAVHSIAEDPEEFMVFRRVLTALRSLKNLGRVGDVNELLRSLGERDESALQTSFATIQGFLWCIPVLGFIGTVLGLSQAIGAFGELLEDNVELVNVVQSLKGVTGGLSTAFETTLIALVIAVVLQLLVTSQRKKEELLLDDISEYCLRNIIGRLRILEMEEVIDT